MPTIQRDGSPDTTRYGGFSGPDGFTRASQSLKAFLNDLVIPHR